MSNPRRLLHFVLQILLAVWLGMGVSAVRAAEPVGCCLDGAAPCCLLAVGGCAVAAGCPGVALPCASRAWRLPIRVGQGPCPDMAAVALPLQVDEIWRPPDLAG
jgi:hypothetical protein